MVEVNTPSSEMADVPVAGLRVGLPRDTMTAALDDPSRARAWRDTHARARLLELPSDALAGLGR